MTKEFATTTNSTITKCACRGLRYCAVCLETERVAKRRGDVRAEGNAFTAHLSMVYNVADGKAHRCAQLINSSAAELTTSAQSVEVIVRSVGSHLPQHFCDSAVGECFAVPGLQLVLDFVSESEEQFLLHRIDNAQWTPSQSGRQKQDYGPRINYKCQRVSTAKFVGLPDYVDQLLCWIDERAGADGDGPLDGFTPVELCNLEYTSERLSSIDLHKDDSWIWGERLVSISLSADCVFTLEHPDRRLLVFVLVPRRSLLCLSDQARTVWRHGIFPCHIAAGSRRVAITLRELANTFLEDPLLFDRYGKDILKRATARIKTDEVQPTSNNNN